MFKRIIHADYNKKQKKKLKLKKAAYIIEAEYM